MSRIVPLKPLMAACPAGLVLALALVPLHGHAEDGNARGKAGQPADFADLSIEELANIEITSVSRRPERLQEAPASVFVITQDDIRRSGARSLPEALRLAPNLQVTRSSNTNYFISARGMNGSSGSPANKLLVMIDGRSVYTPLFSGVFWDEPDVMLEDVERIEVISGPGGTLWGVNAVNGVINITTRHAADTRGDLAVLRGDEDGAQVAFRHGGGGDNNSWRVYGKAFAIGHGELANGAPLDDDWNQGQVGLRADWTRGDDRWGVNANAWRGRQGQPIPGVIAAPGAGVGLGDIDTHGANLTGHWERALAGGASLAVQASYDTRYRKVPPTFTDTVDIADLQFQHALQPRSWLNVDHTVVWGGEYRYSWDHVDNSPFVAFLPASDKQAWASLFAQDEIALRPDLRLTAGARVERNPYTGAELLPNLRLSWHVTPAHALWGAVSRTVRAPSRLDVDSYIPGAPPYLLAGASSIRAEVARVFELGYRGQAGQGLSWSVTAFRNLYDHLRTQEVASDGRSIAFGNGMTGQSRGIEAWGSLQLSDAWRLSAGATALHEAFSLKPGSRDPVSTLTAGLDPAYTAQLRSNWTLGETRELELAVRRVAATLPMVDAYTALDARFGWRLAPGVELSVIGTNLNGGHAEYGPALVRTEVPRTVGVKVVWQR
jgi:iron complex outermembrane receptor protein